MTADQALEKLATSTSDAVQGVLRAFAPQGISDSTVAVVPAGTHPLSGITVPAVCADVSYVDGVTGGNVVVIPVAGARALAALMMGMDPASLEPAEGLDEMELSAVGEAMNQMMASAAIATSEVLGDEVDIAPPVVRTVATAEEAVSAWDHAGQAATVAFSICGVPCLLVQFVPHAFIVRMTRALDEITHEYDSAPLGDALRGVHVRVWAELGRAKLPSARVVGLDHGSVLELDRETDAPVDLYADGMRVATGRLLLDDDGALVLRVEQVMNLASTPTPH